MNTYWRAKRPPDDLFDKLSGLAGRNRPLPLAGLALGALLLGAFAIGYRTRARSTRLRGWRCLGASVLLATSLHLAICWRHPPLAVLIGGGRRPYFRLRALRRRPPRTAVRAMTALALAVGDQFALPFDWRASTDPAALELPRRDIYDYFWDVQRLGHAGGACVCHRARHRVGDSPGIACAAMHLGHALRPPEIAGAA